LTYISQFDLLERVNIENGIYQMFNICCPTLGILEKVASNIANIPYPTKSREYIHKKNFFHSTSLLWNLLFLVFSIARNFEKRPELF